MHQARSPFTRLLLLILAVLASCFWSSTTSAASPLSERVYDDFKLLKGAQDSEDNVSVAPCILVHSDSKKTVTQCMANPVYMLAQTYAWWKQNITNKTPGHSRVNVTVLRPEAKAYKSTVAPNVFTNTISRSALFRLAQKQQYCSTYSTKAACNADTRTPCRYLDDSRKGYWLGVTDTQCVYYTQATFTRLLHWEMYQVELENMITNSNGHLPPEVNNTLAAALDCLWPPYKRQAVDCQADKVPDLCNKLPRHCAPLVDNYRFSCQSTSAVDQWKSQGTYTKDAFNATNFMYRSTMDRLYSATTAEDAKSSSLGDLFTTWFMYMTDGARNYMEDWMANPEHYIWDWMTPETSCSNFVTEQDCVGRRGRNRTKHADSFYCSWSREVLLPGMSNVNNQDYPSERCTLSVAARLEAAILLKPYNHSTIPKDGEYPGYLDIQGQADADFLSWLYNALYMNPTGLQKPGRDASWCGYEYDCRVSPIGQMAFPVWRPANNGPADRPMGSADSCEDAIKEQW